MLLLSGNCSLAAAAQGSGASGYTTRRASNRMTSAAAWVVDSAARPEDGVPPRAAFCAAPAAGGYSCLLGRHRVRENRAADVRHVPKTARLSREWRTSPSAQPSSLTTTASAACPVASATSGVFAAIPARLARPCCYPGHARFARRRRSRFLPQIPAQGRPALGAAGLCVLPVRAGARTLAWGGGISWTATASTS